MTEPKRYVIKNAPPKITEDRDPYLILHLETTSPETPLIELVMQRRALRFLSDEIKDKIKYPTG